MNRHFGSFLGCVSKYNVPFTSFCTNGMLLTESVVDSAIASGLSEIIFSVDGANPGTYEDIRRGAKWHRLLGALDLLRDKKEKAGATKPIGRINFTCMMRNIYEMPEVVRLAKAHGIFHVHVRHLVPVPTEAARDTFKEELAYQKVYNEVTTEARKVADELGLQLFLPDPVPNGAHAAPAGAGGHREKNPYCMLPWFQAIIKPDGDYQLCSRLPNLGNLRNQSFCDIYCGEKLREIRRRLLRRTPDACSWTCGHEAYAAAQLSAEDKREAGA